MTLDCIIRWYKTIWRGHQESMILSPIGLMRSEKVRGELLSHSFKARCYTPLCQTELLLSPSRGGLSQLLGVYFIGRNTSI